jgi:hypothetical protein
MSMDLNTQHFNVRRLIWKYPVQCSEQYDILSRRVDRKQVNKTTAYIS